MYIKQFPFHPKGWHLSCRFYVRYNNKKLNFSSDSDSDSYIITNVMKKRLYYKYHYQMEINNNPSEMRGFYFIFV